MGCVVSYERLHVKAHAGTIGNVADLDALTALHDWMRSHGVTECAVGDTRLVLAPIVRPLTLTQEPPMTEEQAIQSDLNDLLYSSGSDAEAIMEMQRRTDARLSKKVAA